MTAVDLKFARNGATFTMDFLRQLADGDIEENIFFSPFSVQLCMGAVFAGAEGETAEEIATGMKFVSNSAPEVAASFQSAVKKYDGSKQLKIANKVYVNKQSTIKAEYQVALKSQYHAEAESVDFGKNEAAAESINAWVEHKTAGKITNLISPSLLNEQTRLVLLNAIHFKADWQKKFVESRTEEDEFWTSETESVKVQYMHQKAKFNYGVFENLECTVLEMPYKDSDLSMLVLLPDKRTGLKALAEKLSKFNLIDLSKEMSSFDVMVQFPKFKVNYSVELTEVLKKLKIIKMFTENAEFHNMLESGENIYVSNVLHKAFIEVNEEGTEAAAATAGIMMARTIAPLPQIFEADHPFLYVIWNKKNILFAGAFVNAPDA